jgi:hypothetical protein
VREMATAEASQVRRTKRAVGVEQFEMGVAAAGSTETSAHPSAPPWIRPLHGTSFTSTAHRGCVYVGKKV